MFGWACSVCWSCSVLTSIVVWGGGACLTGRVALTDQQVNKPFTPSYSPQTHSFSHSFSHQARFDRFGAVKSCRLVVDKTTGKPKGTAFIEYKAPEPAAAAAAASGRAREGKGPHVTVKGVTLTVDLALTQDDARRLGVEQGSATGPRGSGPHQQGSTAAAAGAGGKFDRRNLYLTKEGFIEEGSAAWAGMSENDRWADKHWVSVCVSIDCVWLCDCAAGLEELLSLVACCCCTQLTESECA